MDCITCKIANLNQVSHHRRMRESGRPNHLPVHFQDLLDNYRLYVPWRSCTYPSLRFADGVRRLRYATPPICERFIAFLAIYDSYLSFHEYANRVSHWTFSEVLLDIQQIAQRVVNETTDPIVADYARGTIERMIFAFKCGYPLMLDTRH